LLDESEQRKAAARVQIQPCDSNTYRDVVRQSNCAVMVLLLWQAHAGFSAVGRIF
jgi:hypothetical protein